MCTWTMVGLQDTQRNRWHPEPEPLERDALGWGFRTHKENAQLQLTAWTLGRAPSHTQMQAK